MAHVHYDIYEVDYSNAIHPEQMGTKQKFWYEEGSPFDFLTLFKAGRPNTGENWAEVIAAQLAASIQLPTAEYQFARCTIDGKIVQGTITPNLVKHPTSRMIHGNELLSRYSETIKEPAQYDPDSRKHHTLTRAITYIAQDFLLPPLDAITSPLRSTALDFFIGYIIFDTLIGNQDRHAENWAIIKTVDDTYHLCPTYDHGSSLGRNELDTKRQVLLDSKDKNNDVAAYCKRAASGFYAQAGSGKSLKLMECLETIGKVRTTAFHEWQSAVKHRISDDLLDSIINPISNDIMTETSKDFTKRFIKHNRNSILQLDLG